MAYTEEAKQKATILNNGREILEIMRKCRANLDSYVQRNQEKSKGGVREDIPNVLDEIICDQNCIRQELWDMIDLLNKEILSKLC